MTSITLQELTEAERADLARCGITTNAQLEDCTASSLLRDIQRLQEFFPNQAPTLTPQRIAELFDDEELGNESSAEENTLGRLNLAPEPHPAQQFKKKRNLKKDILRKQEAEKLAQNKRMEHMHGLSKHFHAVHCSHPFRVFFGAFTAWLLLIPAAGLIVVPIMLLTGDLDGTQPIYFGAAFALLVLPWLTIGRSAICSVCHMPIYRFSHYSHHKQAHHFPLLGYTLPTALHVIFYFWFRCPACGTQLKLFGRRHHHHH